MSSKQYLIDVATRHAVFLERYANGQSREARALLRRLSAEIQARILAETSTIQVHRLSAMLLDIDALNQVAFSELSSTVLGGADDLMLKESALSQEILAKATTEVIVAIPADAALIAAVRTTTMHAEGLRGVTIKDVMDSFQTDKSKEITQLISDSIVLGDTNVQVASKVKELINVKQSRQANALVRTVVSNVSSTSRAELFQANSDILEGYQWVATLDGRTTMICGGRDGKIYQEGVGPMPPAHWNCRSTTIPIVKDEYNLGAKITGQRATKDGPVAANVTYGGWLKRQPKSFIDEALGVERSKLFRSGKLSIDKFTDPVGKIYTLDDLESLYPLVFQ